MQPERPPHIKVIEISDLIRTTANGLRVRVRSTGKALWLPRRHTQMVPGHAIIPIWLHERIFNPRETKGAVMQDDFQELGRPVMPKELAKRLGLDARTVKKYYKRWGGIEVCPGTVRFFENRIKEVLHAEFSNQTRPASIRRDRVGQQPKRSDKTVSRRQRKELSGGQSSGKARRRRRSGKSWRRKPPKSTRRL